MNGYTQVLDYIRSLAEPLVSKVTKVELDKIDQNKKNLFPLLNIVIDGGGFPSDSTILLNVQLTCLDIRDINKEVSEDDFYYNDNEPDNINNCLAVLNRIWLQMQKDFEENNITSSENPTFEIGRLQHANLLDGVSISFDVIVPNTNINLCQ
jgi:hypothetical protein